MDTTLKSAQGYVLVEFLLVIPILLFTLSGFAQLHQVVSSDFEDTRTLRKLSADLNYLIHKTGSAQKLNERLEISIQKTWPKKNPPLRKTPSGFPNVGFQGDLGPLNQLIDLIVEPRTISLTKDRKGLWPHREIQTTTLVPGSLRQQGHLWALSIGILGNLK